MPSDNKTIASSTNNNIRKRRIVRIKRSRFQRPRTKKACDNDNDDDTKSIKIYDLDRTLSFDEGGKDSNDIRNDDAGLLVRLAWIHQRTLSLERVDEETHSPPFRTKRKRAKIHQDDHYFRAGLQFDDLMVVARQDFQTLCQNKISEMSPNKKPSKEDKAVAALVQQMAGMAAEGWYEIVEEAPNAFARLVPPNGFEEKLLLWALHFLKQYPNITVMASTVKPLEQMKTTDNKTLQKWINITFSALNALHPHVIKWGNCFTNDRGNDALAGYSKKLNGPSLRYNVATSLEADDIYHSKSDHIVCLSSAEVIGDKEQVKFQKRAQERIEVYNRHIANGSA
eukprot:jgi/Psemu1/33805/gm1.33805_g